MNHHILLSGLLCACSSGLFAQDAVFTTGIANETNSGLIDCGGKSRVSAVGEITSEDPVPFTPFNSNVVRFTADRPATIAVMMVDWEENLGLGSENNRGKKFHPGDGGFVAHIQDVDGKTVSITDENWRAQTFYTAPIKDKECLVIDGQNRDSSACDEAGVDDASEFFAAHWAVPEGWMEPSFDDSNWPAAITYSNETVGVNNKKAFTNFVDVFDMPGADAQFIWSSNLVLDNLVLLRTTLR